MDFKEKQSHLGWVRCWNLIPCLYRLSVLPHTSQTIIAHDVASVGWQDLFYAWYLNKCLVKVEGSGATFFSMYSLNWEITLKKIARYQSSEPIMTNNETKKVKGHILHQGQCPLLQFQIKDSVLHWMGSSFVRVRLSSRATKLRVVVFCFFCTKVEHSVQWELYFGKVWKRRHEHFAHSAETSRAATTQSLTKIKKKIERDTHTHTLHQ